MNIGIITLCDNWANYGSFLQMYALAKCLEDLGHKVYHVRAPKNERHLQWVMKNYKHDYVLKDDFLKPLRKIWKLYRIANKYVIELHKGWKYMKSCKGINFITIKESSMCDVYLFGSDAIWDVNNPRVGSQFYFGSGLESKKKISFAVCLGDTDVNDLIRLEYPEPLLQEFEHISVRDNVSQKAVEAVWQSEEKCPILCDPTFLIDTKRLQTVSYMCDDKYLLVYAWQVNKTDEKLLVRFARENNLKIVCAMGERKYSFADINMDVSPLAFGNVVRNAEYVYASTFHGCVFSILNMKQAVFSCPTAKVRFLLSEFRMTDRICTEETDYETFCSILKRPIDKVSIGDKILSDRSYAIDWLKKVLAE